MNKNLDNVKLIKIFLENKKINYFKVLDISNISIIADYFMIISVNNLRALNALQDDISEFCAKNNITIKNVEGKATGWILIDCIDIVIHLFVEEDRQFYNLEKVWADAKEISI